MKYIFLVLVSVFLITADNISLASTKSAETPEETLSVFQSMTPIIVSPSIPTVFEISITDPAFRNGDFALYEETSRTFQPTLYNEQKSALPVSFSLQSESVIASGSLSALTDGLSTFVEFPVSPSVDKNNVVIDFQASRSLSVSGLFLQLEPYVALPKTVEISTVDTRGVPTIVLARTGVFDQTIRFPKTTSDHFRVSLEYGQPLRLREISFFNEEALNLDGRSVRFLARPGERYSLYFRADRPFSLSFGEKPNLSSDVDVQKVKNSAVIKNSLYIPADMDQDSIPDQKDNCINNVNSDQRDENNNGRGDVCDDYDRDGVINSKDNCPSHPNLNQRDTDKDDIGDICDGEESRFTESRAWLPWLVMGIGILVVGGLFVTTVRGKK